MSRRILQRMKTAPGIQKEDLQLARAANKRLDQKSYHIFRQKPNNQIEWVRIGSVRLGRTLRAVKQLAKYSRDHYFAAYAVPKDDIDGGIFYVVDPNSKRYYEGHKQKLPEQRRRSQNALDHTVGPLNDRGESPFDVLVDMVHNRLLREVRDAVDQH